LCVHVFWAGVEGGIAPSTFDPAAVYPWRSYPRYPLCRRLGGLKTQTRNKFFVPAGNGTPSCFGARKKWKNIKLDLVYCTSYNLHGILLFPSFSFLLVFLPSSADVINLIVFPYRCNFDVFFRHLVKHFTSSFEFPQFRRLRSEFDTKNRRTVSLVHGSQVVWIQVCVHI
jgi:hypothetical protein